MLCHIEAAEIQEWMAYEMAFGPIDSTYSDNMLASIHEQLQLVILTLSGQEGRGAVHQSRPPELYARGKEFLEEQENAPSIEEQKLRQIEAMNQAMDNR